MSDRESLKPKRDRLLLLVVVVVVATISFMWARSEYLRGRAEADVQNFQLIAFDRGLAVSGLWGVITSVRDSYDALGMEKGDVDFFMTMLKKYDIANPEVEGDKYRAYRARVAAFKKAFPGQPVPEPTVLMSNDDFGGIPAGTAVAPTGEADAE